MLEKAAVLVCLAGLLSACSSSPRRCGKCSRFRPVAPASRAGSAMSAYEQINGVPEVAGGRRDTTAWHLGAMYSAGKVKLQAAMRDYRQRGTAGIAPARARGGRPTARGRRGHR